MADSQLTIRLFTEDDWQAVWRLMQPIIRRGDTYPYAPDMTEQEAYQQWIDMPQQTYVAERKLNDESVTVVGTYYIKPNQPTLGAHVANCGYMVGEAAQGLGVGKKMGLHSQEQALKLGYKAMQYNLVVSTNAAGVAIWQKLGFDIIGTLPGAFQHPDQGFVDAYVMYKVL